MVLDQGNMHVFTMDLDLGAYFIVCTMSLGLRVIILGFAMVLDLGVIICCCVQGIWAWGS